ncbi:MAG: FAD:protein FMN transferase [Planctomycetota bacterium]|jgi:thiamine biosynthesis lipoprotein
MVKSKRYEPVGQIVDWTESRGQRAAISRLPESGFFALLILLALTVSAEAESKSSLQRFDFRRIEMGVEFEIRVYACDSQAANKAATAAFDRIRELNVVMSDYQADSEVRRLCESAVENEVAVSQDLLHVLVSSRRLTEESGGAFDVTVGPLTKLWRRARRREELPPADLLTNALQKVGSEAITLNRTRQTIRLAKAGMRIDLGGIAKGYAADQALEVLKQQGFPRALVDASGDIVAGDPPPLEQGWRIEIASLNAAAEPSVDVSRPPRGSTLVLLANQAIATSGSTVQFVEIDGRRYSHIVDPRTGLGLDTLSLVTVIAPSGMEADSLASAVSVLGPVAGVRFVEKKSDSIQSRVQSVEPSGEVRIVQSRGFSRFVIE